MNLLEALHRSGDQFRQLTQTLDPQELEAESVCADWSVGDVVRHVVSGCRMAASLAGGASTAEAVQERERMINSPLTQALADAIASQHAALAASHSDGFVAHHPIIDMTLTQLVEARLIEFIVHGSDIARSLGRADEIDPALAEVAWAAMAPLVDITGALGVFGTGSSGQLGDGATAADRLLDVTGRRRLP